MSAALDGYRTLIAEGHTKEAAETAKMMAHALPETDVRALVGILADAIMDPKPTKRAHSEKFKGNKAMDDSAGNQIKVDQFRWEMEMYCAIANFQGGTREDAYKDAMQRFYTGRKTVEAIFLKWKKRLT